MTTNELLRSLVPLSRSTVYRHLSALEIKPLGVRQRPQQWPDDAPLRIRARLGMNIHTSSPTDTAAARLATLPELRRERNRLRKVRAR